MHSVETGDHFFALFASDPFVCLAHATKFVTETVALYVETTGELTAGMTIVDRRPFGARQTNAEVITQIDVPSVIDYFCRGLRRIAVSSDGRS